MEAQDFRSKDGLFSVSEEDQPKKKVKHFFHSSAVSGVTPQEKVEWYKFMGTLRETIANAKVSYTHRFLWVLHCKKKLQRIYTQNVDALEGRMGIPLVESPYHTVMEGGYVSLHGSLTQLRCMLCGSRKFFSKAYAEKFKSGHAPPCTSCNVPGNSTHI